jgi:hypothetical protein
VRTLFLSILTTLLSCQDYTVNEVEKRLPQMLVYPQVIDFGHLDAGTQSGQDSFIIVNTGDDDLIISIPQLVSGNTRFSMDTFTEDPITIPGGELLEVNVYYTPETFESNGGFISVVGNDESNREARVLLSGWGDAPVLDVSPVDFDYGDISIGCDNEEHVTISNDGNQDLVIESVVQMVTQPADIILEFGSLPPPPWVIPPGQQLDFLVSYVPSDIGADASDISIISNDPIRPLVELTQIGDGDVEHWYTHSWVQESVPIMDVLWVIDNSGSMGVFQSSLASNVSDFLSVFTNLQVDYKMAVISTDWWVPQNIFTPTTPNVAQQLAAQLSIGIYGSGNEQGLQMAKLSLSNANATGVGSNFFRTDSTLIVIWVSDEQDHSGYWGTFANFFEHLKPQGAFLPFAIVGDPPTGCSRSGQHAEYGAGYTELVNYFNGITYSICSTDWGVQLQNMAGNAVGRRMFILEEADPIVDTIVVTINGQVTNEWVYSESDNAFIFNDGYIPHEGQTISVNYAVWGCEE